MKASKSSAVLTAALTGLLGGTMMRINAAPAPSGSSSTGHSGFLSATTFGQKHACKGQNSCKGRGGCKSSNNGCRGKNSCKGQGGCSTLGPVKHHK